jgi:hypothetical protein
MPTSRYFFSWGPHRKRGDAALRDTLFNQLVAKRLRGEEGSVAESRAR